MNRICYHFSRVYTILSGLYIHVSFIDLFSPCHSDSVANNYSPTAQGLSTHIIYKRTKNTSASVSRRNVNTKKKQEFVVQEDVHVLRNGAHSVTGTYSVLSEGTSGHVSKTTGGTFTGIGFVTKGRSHHFSSSRLKGTKSEYDTTESKEIGLDNSILSHGKPPKLKRVQSAGQAESLRSSGVHDSGYHGDGYHGDGDHGSGSPYSKRTRVAWGSTCTQGAAVSTNEDVIEDLETDLKEDKLRDDTLAHVIGQHYDKATLAVLNIRFPPASTPTLGLPRAVTPPESQQKRYKYCLKIFLIF